MTITSGELNLQSKYNLICHIAKVKVSMSAPLMADISILVYYSSVFNVCFESNAKCFESNANASITLNIFYTH